MIPENWREYHRDVDDELIGYIAESDGVFGARTIVGSLIGEAEDEASAAVLIESVGLSYLADRWLLTIDGRAEPIAVQIAEVSPMIATVRSVDLGYEGDYGTPFRVEVPAPSSRLRPERPIIS